MINGNENTSNVPERKQRTTISLELFRLIRSQITQGKTNKELSDNNSISLSCATTIANKISSGLSDDDIIKKKGRKPVSNTEIKCQVSAIVQSDNALTQKGITETLAISGIHRS